MGEQCFDDFTGDSFMDLIGREGPIEAATNS